MKKQKLPNLVNIAILTVITVVFWIGLDIYRSLTTKPPISVAPSVLAPLDPQLDQTSLDKLSQRVYKETSASGTTQLRTAQEEGVLVKTSPLPEPTQTPIASASAQPSITPAPTP